MKITNILLIMISFVANGQTNPFVVDTFEIESKFESAIISNTKRNFFFEDENYTVTKSCSGEFGGSLFFKDKKTLIVYECESVCAVVINKIDGKYIVTNSLAHLFGSTDIVEIRDPKLLTVYKPRVYPDDQIIRYVGQDESKSHKGMKTLLDSIGVLTSISFPFKNKLYHIININEKLSIAEINDGKFKIIQQLSDKRLWTDNAEVLKNNDNHFILAFEGENNRDGYLDIFENRIKIYYIR